MKDSIAIYVHIPFCKARCGYCAFSSCTNLRLQERYFDKLFEEIEYYADPEMQINTVYIGGGTPSVAEKKYVDALFAKLRDCFDLSQTKEITSECNPESATEETLECFVRNGVNRISFGLQSVNDKTLEAIGRLHSYGDFLSAVERCLKRGLDNINADLIIGLPESHADFVRSVKTVSDLPITHISMYALELHENTPLYKNLQGKPPFSEDEQADMYDEAMEILGKKGFKRYEISNFAKNKPCLHNINYWSEGRYQAFGASASGFVGDVRFTNPWDINEYLATNTETLHETSAEQISLSEQANEFVMLGLRLESGVSLSEFSLRFGKDFSIFFKNVNRLREQGLLLFDGDCVRVPADKFYVVNSILAELLN